MEFIETTIFMRQVQELFTDEEYRDLQMSLFMNPAIGDLIPKGKGLRKVRWQTTDKGKRGGARVIYYWDAGDRIYMFYGYKKNKQENLTPDQLKSLSKLVMENLK